MPPTARRRDAPPPPRGPDEKDVLLGFLDYLRASVVAKVDGVAEPAVRAPQVTSGTNLLGLLEHPGHVERATFLGEHLDDWQAIFRPGPHDTGNVVIGACDDLAAPIRLRGPSMCWALAHMIEETGRHAGPSTSCANSSTAARGADPGDSSGTAVDTPVAAFTMVKGCPEPHHPDADLGHPRSRHRVERRAVMRARVASVVSAFLFVGAVTTAAASPQPPIAAQEPVVGTFTTGAGDQVPYRVGWYGGGSAGFGRTKVVGKHKITNDDIVAAVVRSPQSVRTESPYVIHEKEAILVSLFGDDERLTVRVVINYGAWNGPGRQGVVTAYCVGPVECPDWINRAFASD